MFANNLAKFIMNPPSGSSARFYLQRNTHSLAEAGFPPDTPEAQSLDFDGDLVMELGGVEIMGLDFTVTARFTGNAGVITRRFTKSQDYFHVPISIGSENASRLHIKPNQPVSVGFPWALAFVQVQSRDAHVQIAAPEITKSIVQKYQKYVKQIAAPQPNDQNRESMQSFDYGLRHLNDDGNPVILKSLNPYTKASL